MFERDHGDLRPEPAPWGAAEDSPQAWPPASQPPPVEGNRPARHARQVESASQAENEWRGGEDVTDFLGLDQDLLGGVEQIAAAAGVAHHAVVPPAPQAYPVEPEPDPEVYGEAPADGLDPEGWLLEELAEDEAQAEGAESTEDVDLLQGSWSEPARGGKRWPLMAGGLVAAAVLISLGVGLRGWLAPAPLEAPGGGQELANARKRPAPVVLETPSAPEPAPVAVERETEAGITRVATGTRAPDPRDGPRSSDGPSREIVEALEQGLREGAAEASVRADLDPEPSDESPLSGPPSLARDPSVDVAPKASGGATAEPAQPGAASVLVQAQEPATPPPPSGRLRYPSSEELTGIWQDSAIPLESIDAPRRIVTPNVGRVRVVLREGQIYEGRLYAIGAGKLWLDVELGRLGLSGEQVASVEHVTTPAGGPALGEKGSQHYAGLPRVRVRLPGGVFYGKLLHRDGSRVTLLTDEGGRVTLESDEIEPAPLSRRVKVVGFSEELAGG